MLLQSEIALLSRLHRIAASEPEDHSQQAGTSRAVTCGSDGTGRASIIVMGQHLMSAKSVGKLADYARRAKMPAP